MVTTMSVFSCSYTILRLDHIGLKPQLFFIPVISYYVV